VRTALLEWAEAQQQDIPELHQFECTRRVPVPTDKWWEARYEHPAERRAECLIRDLRPAKDARRGRQALLGRDDQGIAAVFVWTWERQNLAVVNVVALHCRVRGSGARRYSSDMVESAAEQIAGEAADRGVTNLFVVANIHESNRASRAFADWWGMRSTGEISDDGYELFSVRLGFAAMR